MQPKVVVPGLGRDALRPLPRPRGHRREHPAGARRGQRDAAVRRSAGRHTARLQRVPQGQRPGRPGPAGRDAAVAGHPRSPPRQDGRAGRRRVRHAVLHLPPRRPDQVPARAHGAGGLHLHERRLPRRHGAGRRQPGRADQPEAWLHEPTCGGCHGARYAENPGQLYRNSYLAQRPRGHERQSHPVRVVPRQPARGVAVAEGRSTTRCRCSCRVWRRSSSAAAPATATRAAASTAPGPTSRVRRRETRAWTTRSPRRTSSPQLALTYRAAGDDGDDRGPHRRRVPRARGARGQDRRPVGPVRRSSCIPRTAATSS